MMVPHWCWVLHATGEGFSRPIRRGLAAGIHVLKWRPWSVHRQNIVLSSGTPAQRSSLTRLRWYSARLLALSSVGIGITTHPASVTWSTNWDGRLFKQQDWRWAWSSCTRPVTNWCQWTVYYISSPSSCPPPKSQYYLFPHFYPYQLPQILIFSSAESEVMHYPTFV